MKDIFKTIKAASQGLFKEKGSKFLAFSHPVTSEDDIKEHIDTYKKQYYDARHASYAYRLGSDGDIYRFNDDGEPSGTAGKPIHGQLLSFDLTNVLVVVVRYFGGTKLGVSGLISAYKTAAKDALENAEIIEETVTRKSTLSFDYPLMNDVMRLINEENLEIVMQNFELQCEIIVAIRLSEFDQKIARLKQLYGLKVEVD